MLKAKTSDGITIYGHPYFGRLGKASPLILMFHQAGSNGRGEYEALVPWLNKAGYRVIVWDQRVGGERFGSTNRTIGELAKGTPAEYCDVYPDLQAALNFTLAKQWADDVIVWGSSYSAALVVQLAAKNQKHIKGVAAFSPASGGPLTNCRARKWIDRVEAPVLVVRPKSEMVRESSIEQKSLLVAAGAKFKEIDKGVHGSSTLVDKRTGHDMTLARNSVMTWLKGLDRGNNRSSGTGSE